MGALSFIQVAADSVGKKVRTYLGADGTHSETAVIVDTEGVQQATSGAPLRVDPTGTTTQPVSGSVSVSNFPASQDVDSNLDEIAGVAVVTAAAGVQKVGIVGATGTALDSTAGVLDENLKNVGGSALTLGQKAAASSIPVVLDSDTDRGQKTMANSIPVVVASDQAPVEIELFDSNEASIVFTTKGTQQTNAIPTQDFKDSGRVNIAWTAEVAGAATTEGLLTVTESRDGAATTTFTTKVVTSGKRLRITSLSIAVESLGSGTAPQRVYLRLRFNTAGAVTTASPIQGSWECANDPAVVKTGSMFSVAFPDGIEYLGDGTKQIGWTIQFPDWVTTTATVQAKVSITAFEY